MQAEPTPTIDELIRLTEVRDEACISIHLSASNRPVETGGSRVRLHSLIGEAKRRLEQSGTAAARRNAALDALRELENDDDLWRNPSPGLVVLATPEELHAFTVRDRIDDSITIADRFELAPLVREATTPDRAYLLALTEGEQRLWLLTRGQPPTEIPLELPYDLASVFAFAVNHGDRDLPRSGGPEGDQPEQRRFCGAVQDAVLARIGESGHPLVLASSTDLEPVYRAVNRYHDLLAAGMPNPSYQEPAELDRRAWELLDAAERERLAQWRELFGTRRSHGLATTRLKEVAVAATAAGVEELLFNVDFVVEGSIDEFGRVQRGTGYNVVDEIAARVLRGGGTVRGVHNADLLDGSPVAAMLRFPVPA